MKHYLIPAIIMALSLVPSIAQAQGYDFSAENEDGKIFYYNILSEADRTCYITYQEEIHSENDAYLCEVLNIPAYANGYEVVGIGSDAFHCCHAKKVTIPNTVKWTGSYAFAVSNLESVTFGNSVEVLGSMAFINCPNLKEITLPNSLTTIEEEAFEFCENLESVTFGNNLKTIKGGAFHECKKLKSVTLPESLTSIESVAFAGCPNLTTVKSFITDVFETGKDVFLLDDNAILYVPYGLSETYRNTAAWNSIPNIVEMDPASVPMQLACNSKGSMKINNKTEFTKGIGTTNIFENAGNTFTFTPNPGCRLDQVILNGLDITANVEGNTLTCTIPSNSQMIVTFTNEQGDLNNDGTINISDVVTIVNKILGN